METLIEEIKKTKEEEYKKFVEKYGKRIDEKLKEIFIDNHESHWYKGVYGNTQEGTLLYDIYWDNEINGGRFNNLLKYAQEKGFKTSAYMWCGGACVDADGFEIKL